MSKIGETTIEALVEGGQASGGPPLGPALGPAGVNIGQVVSKINEKTKQYEGMQVPVKVIVDTETKEFEIEVGSPPVSAMLKSKIGIESGSGEPNQEKVADTDLDIVIEVAQSKIGSMLSFTLEGAIKEVLGTCHSMGVTVNGEDPKEVIKEINEGEHNEKIEGAK